MGNKKKTKVAPATHQESKRDRDKTDNSLYFEY